MTRRSRKRIWVLERELQLQTLLAAEWPPAQVSVCGFSRSQECLEKLATEPCDLLVVDLEGDAAWLGMLQQVRQTAPWIPCLAMVKPRAVACAVAAIKAGACDCLEKPVQPDQLTALVQRLLIGRGVPTHYGLKVLTPTEVHVLQLILAGETSQEIAAELHRSVQTIHVHRKNILRKLHATSMTYVIKWALEMHLDAPPQRAPGVAADDWVI